MNSYCTKETENNMRKKIEDLIRFMHKLSYLASVYFSIALLQKYPLNDMTWYILNYITTLQHS